MTDTIARSTKIARWGHSAAVRIGANVLVRANLSIDDLVDIIADDDGIVIRRQKPRVTMDELLAGFDPVRHRHDLNLDDAPIGNETSE
jgi:antitoxin component of MazEF toxin-antitoxin module